MTMRPRAGSDAAVYGNAINGEEVEDWSNHPRTLSVGFITLIWFIYAAFRETPDDGDGAYNAKRGIKYACLFFLVFSVLQLRDGHFIRPHAAVWRLITGVFILYEIFLIVLLFQNTGDARKLLQHIDSSLGVELPDRSYGDDCRIYTPNDPLSNFRNVRDTVLDEFVLMHFFGWLIGALMVRDYVVCWTISILFETYELTFQHWLLNFRECWWDHIFLDVLICNALGIWLGMRICKFFEMKGYNWVGIRGISNFKGKATRAIAQFTPADWLPYDWAMFRSASRFWRVMFMVFALSVMMLNSFFLKTVLWVPPTNPLNVYRLFIWYSAGSYAVAEYYVFCTTPVAKKLGPRAWLGIAVVITEVMVIIKHGDGYFTEPFPTTVKLAWLIVAIVVVGGSSVYFMFFNQSTSLQPQVYQIKTTRNSNITRQHED